jgi:hypothetical protein
MRSLTSGGALFLVMLAGTAKAGDVVNAVTYERVE